MASFLVTTIIFKKAWLADRTRDTNDPSTFWYLESWIYWYSLLNINDFQNMSDSIISYFSW